MCWPGGVNIISRPDYADSLLWQDLQCTVYACVTSYMYCETTNVSINAANGEGVDWSSLVSLHSLSLGGGSRYVVCVVCVCVGVCV